MRVPHLLSLPNGLPAEEWFPHSERLTPDDAIVSTTSESRAGRAHKTNRHVETQEGVRKPMTVFLG